MTTFATLTCIHSEPTLAGGSTFALTIDPAGTMSFARATSTPSCGNGIDWQMISPAGAPLDAGCTSVGDAGRLHLEGVSRSTSGNPVAFGMFETAIDARHAFVAPFGGPSSVFVPPMGDPTKQYTACGVVDDVVAGEGLISAGGSFVTRLGTNQVAQVADARFFAIGAAKDGFLVIGGAGPGGPYDCMVYRFNSDLTPSKSFGGGSASVKLLEPYTQCFGIVVQADGRVLVRAEGTSTRVVRLDAHTGKLDVSFGTAGVVTLPTALRFVYSGEVSESTSNIALQSDGRILIGGLRSPLDGKVAFIVYRFLPDGRLDSCYGDSGRVEWPLEYVPEAGAMYARIAVDPLDRLVMALAVADAPLRVRRFLP